MKKKIFIIMTAAVVLILAMALAGCGDVIGNVTSNVGGGNTENTKATTKIDLSEAAKNYDKEEVKKSEIEFTVTATVNTKIPSVQTYNVGSTLEIDRIQNKDKVYVAAGVKPTNTDTGVSGLLQGALYLMNSNDEKVQRTRNILEAVHHYLIEQLDMKAELGAENGVYNMKAFYNDKEENVEDDIWFAANDASLAAYLRGAFDANISTNDLELYLMKTLFVDFNKNNLLYGKDSANKFVDKKGVSSYDISLNTEAEETVATSAISAFLDMVGADKRAFMEQYDRYLESSKNWLVVKTEEVKSVSAAVKGKLPTSINTGATISIMVKTEEVIDFVNELQASQALDEESLKTIKYLIGLLSTYFLGPDCEAEGFGCKLDFDISEKFSYGATECDLAQKEAEGFFTALDQNIEGRTTLNDILAGVIDDVDQYLATALASINDQEKRAEIIAKIKEKVDEFLQASGAQKITVDQITPIIKSILQEYLTDESGDITITDEQVQKGIDAAKDLYNRWKK